ncbi:SulP family inorganic anion transporter [Prolixibacter denitrificans]|uniref:Sodium-independent anion transporter n=1 Tax=Prolixibacter denitrificans TaxID=1541063 RepID=A0A2P8CIP9_9BACT|nr:SulP family inorganic anion transporter [Prolixibacter denitrificans]PSK84829.1 SulP family sulfate permease [Prolixibacter denitrificans]GET20994.1 sodium-independent anion transporter [Prolixibacter denitrificans]
MQSIFKPKFFTILKGGYSRQTIVNDLLAGVIVGIVAIPLAIAFAVASGVSPEKGLATAIIAGFLISFLGGSRVQIGGPTGAFIVVVAGIVGTYGIEGLAISTMMAGVILILFGLLRLGAVLKFIPRPLTVGFTSGIALVIFTTQVKDALGLHPEHLPAGFLPKWGVYLTSLNQVNPAAVIITITTILITIYGGKLLKRIPGSFLAILIITPIVALFHLPVHTIESVFGEIQGSISFQIPHLDWSNLQNYVQPALTIAMLGAIESLLSAVVADGMIGGHHRSNTELIAQGIANLASPLFGGIPATGAIARTATNVKNGGRTPLAGMIHAVTLLLIMLFFGKWAKLIPMPVLAGILMVVAYNMSEWRSFRSVLKGSKYDVLVLLTVFFLTVLVDLTVAIEVGIVLSALLFMQRMGKLSSVEPMEQDTDVIENYSALPRGVDVYEISGPFFFAAAQEYRDALRNIHYKSNVLILRMRHVPFIDSTGIHNFVELLKEMEKRGIRVILSGVKPEVRRELGLFGIDEMVGEEYICETFANALKQAGLHIAFTEMPHVRQVMK